MLHTIADDIIPSQTSEESNQQSSSQLSSVSTNCANSPTSLSLSQITPNDIEQPPNSQLSDSSTITLSSPSQTVTSVKNPNKLWRKSAKQLMVFSLKKKNNYEVLVIRRHPFALISRMISSKSGHSFQNQPSQKWILKCLKKYAVTLVLKICKSP